MFATKSVATSLTSLHTLPTFAFIVFLVGGHTLTCSRGNFPRVVPQSPFFCCFFVFAAWYFIWDRSERCRIICTHKKNKNGRSTSALWWGDEFTVSLAGVTAGFEVCASSQNASRSWASSSIWVLFVGYFVCTPACVWFAQANLVARRREMEMGRRGRRRLGVYAALPRETDDFFSFPSFVSFLQDGGKLSRPKPVLDVNTSSLAGKGNAAVWRSR